MSTHLSVATSTSFGYEFSEALDRSNPLGHFVILVASVEYDVGVRMAYLQGAQDGCRDLRVLLTVASIEIRRVNPLPVGCSPLGEAYPFHPPLKSSEFGT